MHDEEWRQLVADLREQLGERTDEIEREKEELHRSYDRKAFADAQRIAELEAAIQKHQDGIGSDDATSVSPADRELWAVLKGEPDG